MRRINSISKSRINEVLGMCKICLFLLGSVLFVACSSSDKERETDEVGKLLGDGGSSLPEYPNEDDGAFIIPHNPNNGSIKEYPWNEYVLAFKEPSNYPYGFDRDPAADMSPEKDNVVYISVADGEQAYFIPQLVDDTYSCYRLVNDLSHEVVALEKSISPVYLDAGKYSLFGKKDNVCNSEDSWISLNRRIEVISYSKLYKNFIYVQVDGDGWNAEADENSFTLDKVKSHFDDVFGQALVYANPTPISQNAYGLSDLIEMDMLNPSDEIAEHLFDQVRQGMRTVASNYQDDPKYHVVFAINKERKIWPLDNCLVNEDYSITTDCIGINFNPMSENESSVFYIVSRMGGGFDRPTQVDIRMDENGNRYYLYEGTKRVNFSRGDAVYTDNGFPVVPSKNGAIGGTAAVSYSIAGYYTKDSYAYPAFDGYLPYGSMILTPRGNGKNRQYTLMHEIGHSFGFTDVEKQNLWKLPETAIVDYTKYFKDGMYYDVGVSYPFENVYASSETNLMAWQLPSGRKIRYRETPIACTGGTEYYLSGSGSFVGSLERSLSYASTSYGLTSIGDRQWECIRGDCFKSTLATEARKMFWLHNGYCLDMTTPTPLANEAELLDPSTDVSKILYQTDKAKYISSYENFQKLNQRVDLGKYVNKTSVESD